MVHYFCRLPKIEDFCFKEIRQPNRAETFQRLAHVKRHVPNRSETSTSVSGIFEFGWNLFSSSCGILDVTRPIGRVF